MAKLKRKTKLSECTLKQKMWLQAYYDCANIADATRVAYKTENTSVGYQNYQALLPIIERHLKEIGLTETGLKMKLSNLVDAKETRFFTHEGRVTGCVEVEALSIQRAAVDMGFKILGTYAPERRELAGKDGGPIETAVALDVSGLKDSDLEVLAKLGTAADED